MAQIESGSAPLFLADSLFFFFWHVPSPRGASSIEIGRGFLVVFRSLVAGISAQPLCCTNYFSSAFSEEDVGFRRDRIYEARVSERIPTDYEFKSSPVSQRKG